MQSMDTQKSNEKYSYSVAMIFIDFGLRTHTAKHVTYLLPQRHVLKFDNLHMTQCAEIIVGFMANVGNVSIKRLQTLCYFFHVLTFLTFFVFFAYPYFAFDNVFLK